MLKDELRSISPLDGRYSKRLQALEERFSEYALIKSRLKVEIESVSYTHLRAHETS